MTFSKPRLSAIGAGILGAGLVLGAPGCAPPPPEPPHHMAPVDQQRAMKILAGAMRDKGLTPTKGRKVTLSTGAVLEVDVGAQGYLFGIAYLTKQEMEKVGPSIPGGMPEDSKALKVVRGTGADQNARILVLASTNYATDDEHGADREDSTVTAENKLARDARDFLARAQFAKWP